MSTDMNRRLSLDREIADPNQRQLEVVRSVVDGGSSKSIATYGEAHRMNARLALKRWEEYAGLPDGSRAHQRRGPGD
jgi:hypothetical protein